MNKPSIQIYINNTIAFIIYKALKIFFKRKDANHSNSILFINTGQIGDLVISSLILDNDDIYNDLKVYFLIKEKYVELFKDYDGNVNIFGYNCLKYKWSLFYKIKFIKYLHSLKLSKCYNVTSARGILNDEMALLCGAKEIFCLNSDWRYLKKAFGKKMDREYDEVLYKEKSNEYEKHIEILKELKTDAEIDIKNKKSFSVSKSLTNLLDGNLLSEKYMTIAPLSADMKKSWGLKNYKLLCENLSERFRIILLGSINEIDKLKFIKSGNENVINTAGKFNLNAIPTLIKNGIFFIGNDSGLTHLALKLNVPLIAIIGGGSYGKFFPFDEENPKVIYLYDKMDCFGCEWKCIYKERFCLTNVKINTVLDNVKKLI